MGTGPEPGHAEPDLASHPTGQHRLGPGVVGHRVVIRSLVRGETGPSGGPAMTDVLGVCEAWGDSVVVRREDGTAVTVPVGDIVSGKPVPPRPSVRHRVSARAAELHGLVLWPGLETEPHGPWLLRSEPAPAGRLFKRANSCLAMEMPEEPVVEAIGRVGRFYAARHRTPLAQVEQGSDVEAAFLAAGWRRLGHGDAAFDLTSVAHALRTCHAELSARERRPDGALLRTIPRYREEEPRLWVELGEGVARGRAAIDGDWLGLYDVFVASEHRGRGWALRVVADLLDWGAARGATTAWLHVEDDNQPARTLWSRLGFRTHHRSRFLTRDLGSAGP